MKRHFYFVAGWLSLALGAIGAILPLLPTVPFVILAAFCFARSSPRLEMWLVTHPVFGPHIVAWRQKGAISRKGKVAASLAFAFSILLALIFAPWPWMMAPIIAAVATGSWIWTRPEN
ncbi:MAG: YbaN family protein [Sphingopyxis sp.]|nr:YbaN family protein [Sphingopyxis sp.]